MQLYDVLAAAQDGRAIPNLAQACGVEPERMEAAVKAILPSFAHGLERNTLSRGGLADFVAAIGDGHHEVILDNPAVMADPRVLQDGNAILAHVLGSKDRSRAVALEAARASGLSDSLIKMLMPFIAQMIMGAIAKWAKGGLGDVISKLPGGLGGQEEVGTPVPRPRGSARQRPAESGSGSGGFELPRSEMPQGGFPMPPLPPSTDTCSGTGAYPEAEAQPRPGRSGRPWPEPRQGDDTGGRSPFPFPFPFPFPQADSPERESDGGTAAPRPGSGRFPGSGGGFELPRSEMPPAGFPMPPIPGGTAGGGLPPPRQTAPQAEPGGFPLPLPGGGRDNPYGDLSDILKRGGKIDGVAAGGLVRNILGTLLGFGRGGVLSWFLRLIIMRWGWGLLKRLLGRALTGR